METKGKNHHAGHRERTKAIFLERGLEGMPDHLVLELLLFYAIPRVDTNPIAHRLIDRFGSLRGVFDAEQKELQEVEGIGESAAVLLKFIPSLCERYSKSKVQKRMSFSSIAKAGEFFMEYYLSKTKEEVTALFLDNSDCLISFERVHVGSINSSAVNARRLAEMALKRNAASLILAHNHPLGDIKPSESDISTTRHLMDAFLPIDLHLKAHLVVAGNRYTDILPMLYDHAGFKVKYIAVRSSSEAEDQRPELLSEPSDEECR